MVTGPRICILVYAYVKMCQAVPSKLHPSLTVANGNRRIKAPCDSDAAMPLNCLLKTFSPLEFPPALVLCVLTRLSHRNSVSPDFLGYHTNARGSHLA
jgi:hypothetical protein